MFRNFSCVSMVVVRFQDLVMHRTSIDLRRQLALLN
jgi:hypothetical protein